MRRIAILVLLLLTVGSQGAAYEPFSRDALGRTGGAAVAWLEDDTLFVAVANPSSSRQRFIIEPISRDRSGSDAFQSFSVTIPGRTVVLESVRLGSAGRTWRSDHPVHDSHPRWGTSSGEVSELNYIGIDGGRGARYSIPVQITDAALPVQRYVVYDEDVLEFDLDLDLLLEGRHLNRLVVGDYEVLGTRQTGVVSVVSVEGGFRVDSSRLEVTYAKPSASLRFSAPPIRESGILSFHLEHVDEQNRRQVYDGPMILVIGSLHYFQDNTGRSSSRTVR